VPDTTTRTLSMTIAAEKNCHSANRQGNPIIIRPGDLPALLSISRTTIWRLERAGNFPQRIRLSAGAVGYDYCAVLQWAATRQTVGIQP